MKFSVATCCAILASASVATAEWSSYFKRNLGALADEKVRAIPTEFRTVFRFNMHTVVFNRAI